MRHDDHADNFVAILLETNAGHAAGRPAHGANIGLDETDGQAFLGTQQHLVLTGADVNVDQLIVVFQADGDDAGGADVHVGRQSSLFNDALLGREHHELLFLGKVFHGKDVGDFFVWGGDCGVCG